ncbi:DNA cytosine methyltransferase [Pseudomonas sp. GL-RE-29]|jgi:DNA (cytosine-5)-methyltransferase 1|uniref:DNA cytosine methyltransferase n=1 Tax=Pseudomonas sp. GL-RE-29 TaxID=2832375 RepID=UPI001CBAC653|nr:DNA cytosine methyltransferase [Pseudomonas sp. GL-RE-29]
MGKLTLDKLDSFAISGNDRAASQTKALTCVDLFAGAGGFSLAAQRCGIKIIAAVELNKHACRTYRENLVHNSTPHLYEANILELEPHDLVAKHFSEGEECDILLGGPPCQGFSVHRINDSGVDDPRNSLVLRYFEYVSALKPKIFLMENVPGILWKRHDFFLKQLYLMGEAAGYHMFPPAVVDARDFGVPQRRKRVFILGVRNDIDSDLNWPPEPTHGDEKSRISNPKLLKWKSSGDIFKKPVAVDDVNNIHMNHSASLVEVFRNTPLNGGSRKDSGRVLPCHDKHNGHTDVYGRINPSEPAPTMTTACVNPSKGRFVHPTEHHGITLRQAARFQTFPDNYVFHGGLMAGGAQVGNAVPIQLGEALLNTITSALLSYTDIKYHD